ncbi:MAG: long-chain fatty acid--CoA ligase [Prevotella sp.]|nr:long-chain fatty acid--CoA ligase [Prevotella sp.]MBR1839997.1 long-chain fatty acid--CoA ligase [Prevotella sp.]
MQTVCHLALLPHEQAKKYGDRTVFEYKDFGGTMWRKVSWNEFSDRVKAVSNALLNLGVGVQENIGVFSQNALPYLYTDFGAFGVRAATIPFYATSSEQQLQYVINDAQIRIVFVGEQEQYDKARRVQSLCPTFERIVIYDAAVTRAEHDVTSMYFDDFLNMGEGHPRQAEVERLWGEANDDDIANILYTSGTTGESKGVVLTYGQYAAAFKANDECVPVGEKDRVITFLPIAHIFERGWDFLALTEGSTLIINTNPHEIQQSMRETHPTCMSAVPRFWEKVYAGIQAKIDGASPMQKKLFKEALAIGRKYNVECKACGKRPSLMLTMKYKAIDKTLLAVVRKQFGLEKPNIFPTAGAVVSPEVETFVHSLGLNMIVGYGLTESLATVSCDHRDEPYTIGSVGKPISGIDVKIGDNNEILLKGPTITRGYYKREALNKESFTEDGYFRTGDAGYMRDGELFLTERIKDLYKTSNGKYIAPQAVESKLLVDKFIEQIVVIAEERKFVSALIVPAYPMLEEYAREQGIPFKGREDLCSNEKIKAMLKERIDTLQQGLSGYEQVKRFTLLTMPFTMESGELTNTLKTRRPVVIKNYAEVIEAMYSE